MGYIAMEAQASARLAESLTGILSLADILVPMLCSDLDWFGVICFNVPQFWMLFDELRHQIFAFLVIEHNNLNTSLLQILLTPNKRAILANDNPLHLVHKTGTSTHIAR
jgi:TRAP-type mannitol/chloroaromatic compound transport system permease large subunit